MKVKSSEQAKGFFESISERKISFFRKIELWWSFEGKYIISNFKKGVKNLYKWFPVIWKDRDYDHNFIYDILEQKLRFQSDYINKRDWHTRAKRDSEIIKMCANLIKNIKDDKYESEYFDYYKSDINFIPTDEDPKLYSMEVIEISENFDEFFKLHPLAYKKVLARGVDGGNFFDNDTKLHIAMNIGRYNNQRAKDILFRTLNEKIDGWWT